MKTKPLKMEKPSYEEISPFFDIAQQLESFAVRSLPFSALYGALFYKKMLNRELVLAGLRKEDSLLHIGCGSFPYTALYLAERGYQVEACDYNESAVDSACQLIKERGLSSKISVFHKNGLEVDCSLYDAIWLSLNIYPKGKILFHIMKTMKTESKLIFRNLYKQANKTDNIFSLLNTIGDYRISRVTSSFGTESVMVINKSNYKAEQGMVNEEAFALA